VSSPRRGRKRVASGVRMSSPAGIARSLALCTPPTTSADFLPVAPTSVPPSGSSLGTTRASHVGPDCTARRETVNRRCRPSRRCRRLEGKGLARHRGVAAYRGCWRRSTRLEGESPLEPRADGLAMDTARDTLALQSPRAARGPHGVLSGGAVVSSLVYGARSPSAGVRRRPPVGATMAVDEPGGRAYREP